MTSFFIFNYMNFSQTKLILIA